MATSIKELSERIESNNDKLSARLEQSQQELRAKIEKNASDLAAAQKEASAAISSVDSEVAKIKTTIDSAKLIGIMATVVFALLGSAGIWKIVQSQAEVIEERDRFQKLTAQARQMIVLHGKTVKMKLIEDIETELNSEASLDQLKDKPQVQRIAVLGKELEKTNELLDPEDRTHYHKMP